MKKTISILLLLAMCLSLFAGCGEEEAQAPASDLPSAIAYLTNMYQTAGKDKNIIITSDLDVISSVAIGGVNYDVAWTVEVTSGTADSVTVGEGSKDKHVKLDITEKNSETVLFTATATVSDSTGAKQSVSFKYEVPGVVIAGDDMTDEELVQAAYALEEGQTMEGLATLTGVITRINTPWDAGYQNITVTIQIGDLEDMKIQCYRLKGEGADALGLGDTITVSGSLKNYSGTIEFDAGCQLEEVIKNTQDAPEAPEDPAQILAEAYALSEDASLPYIATLTGVITSVDTPWDEGYQNITVTIVVDGHDDQPIKCYRIKGEGASALGVGDTITVTGMIVNYKGIIEFEAGSALTEVIPSDDPVAPTDPSQPSDPTDPTEPSDLPTEPSQNTEPTQPATDAASIVNAAYALEDGESLPYTSTLTGEIIAINTVWSDTYNNITVTMNVEGVSGKPIMCYRLQGDGAKDLTIGDTITVTGTLKNYKGTIEFDQGCNLDNVVKTGGPAPVAPSDPKEIVNAAYELDEGASLPYSATLTGKIVAVDTPYSEEYKNVTVTIQIEGVEDKPITCYRLKGDGAQDLKVGDTITVTGNLKNYYGTIEFDTGCQLVSVN